MVKLNISKKQINKLLATWLIKFAIVIDLITRWTDFCIKNITCISSIYPGHVLGKVILHSRAHIKM